ncbi:MAG TPA: hypothetical protein VK759_02000, partial [Rhizomicrobium sp.]|nr:hypothetical protein [Rhizomicrobium sp.]
KARRLAARLKDNARVLSVAHLEIVKATRAHRPITPAAEWLLDNFHVVDEQIREIQDDLPPGFYRKLPKLADGPLAGYPRVFGIAWALIAHTDSAFDLQKLTRFVEAYQRVQPLTIGELWAIAITLRIMLVENLRRLAEGIVARLAASQAADMLADRILGTDTANPEPVAEAIKGLNDVPWSTAFAVQLAQRLRDRDPTTTPALQWLNDRLKTQGMTTDQIVRDEVQRQGAMNVTVRNVITSMRLVSTINWAEFFESVSLVDEVLREGSDFAAMDFPTRDRYRRAIEELARGADRNEVDIARRVVVKAQRAQAASSDKQCRECDPGFYLLSTGRFGFEEELGCRISLTTRFFRTSANVGVMSYVGMIGLVTALVLAAALWAISYFRIQGWELAGFAVLGFVPASDVAVAIVNRIITQWIGALMLPGLELKGGLPNDLRAIIVVPTLLTSKASVEEHIERLEVHHLSNPDENFSYALLSDWTDSQTEHALDDDELLNIAIAGVARLNERYNEKDKPDRFYLLHRRRVWNAGENKWIGWERKRGKLHELNRFLRGATDT